MVLVSDMLPLQAACSLLQSGDVPTTAQGIMKIKGMFVYKGLEMHCACCLMT